MYVIEYLDAIVTSFGSFESEALAQDWIDNHADVASQYRVVEIPANPYGFRHVEASSAATAPGYIYVRHGARSNTLPVKT